MCHIQLPAVFMTGEKQIAYLGETEGHGIIRPYRHTHDRPGIAVDTGRDVDTENRFPALVDQPNNILIKTFDISG